MESNLDRYKKDLDELLKKGEYLEASMTAACYPEKLEEVIKGKPAKEAARIREALPNFLVSYQSWYSEAKVLIRQLLPDRLADFVRHYEKPRTRREITTESYTIEDYLQGVAVTKGYTKERVVGPEAAIPHFIQQESILRSVKARFESSLFEIRQLVQADLFDSELDAAKELAKHKFTRAAGALAGVVLERHLLQVCDNHRIAVTKKAPCISDLNEMLKAQGVLDVATWRFVQHLADIRNTCDHSKKTEPTVDQVADLLAGATKLTKTLF